MSKYKVFLSIDNGSSSLIAASGSQLIAVYRKSTYSAMKFLNNPIRYPLDKIIVIQER